jgi:hypothetical protein
MEQYKDTKSSKFNDFIIPLKTTEWYFFRFIIQVRVCFTIVFNFL